MTAVSPSRSNHIGNIILGVDDAPENLLLLGSAIEAAGYPFVGVHSGAECLSLVLRMVPRLVLLDIEMPEMNGFDTCRWLRWHPEVRHIPIAFLTARKTAQDVRMGIAAGGNDFLIKPFDCDALLDRVRHWTSRLV